MGGTTLGRWVWITLETWLGTSHREQAAFHHDLCFSSCFLLAIGCVTSQLPALAAVPATCCYAGMLDSIPLESLVWTQERVRLEGGKELL